MFESSLDALPPLYRIEPKLVFVWLFVVIVIKLLLGVIVASFVYA